MPLPEGTQLGPYGILGLIGAGGMGEVYRARDQRLGRDVAVKVLSPRLSRDEGSLRRFEHEARAAGALNHPNVVAVHDVGQHEGTPYVVTELLEGCTLREQVGVGLTVQKAIDIAVQVARGLSAAHDRNIVHRDLKPANIFVTTDGQVKIIDFGLAKLHQPQDALDSAGSMASTATAPGSQPGTVGYMAPELVDGKPSDARADIFALGVVLYEMLSGTSPFRCESTVDTLAAVLHADPPPLAARNPRVPPVLEALVRRCLEKAPTERFQSARDLGFALEGVRSALQSSGSGRGSSPRAFLPGQTGGLGRRIRSAAVVLILLTLAMVAGRMVPWPRPPLATPHNLAPRQLTSEPGVESEPALSPDGSLVAYTVQDARDTDIWLVDVRGGPSLRLTDNPSADRSPAWFPDGASIAFVSGRDGREGIWQIHRLGGPPSRLLADASEPAVSPDGTRLAFVRPAPSGRPRIGVVEIARPESARLITGDADNIWGYQQPAWSPDGRTLCFSDLRDLWLVDVAGGPLRPLTRDHAYDTHPAFAPDGRHVYFSSSREGTLAVWRIGIDGRSLQRITFGTGPENEPSLAVAAARLAYSTYSAEPDLAVIDRLTGEHTRIAGARTEEAPTFLPDGRGIVFGSNRGGDWDLWVQPVEGGRPSGAARRLTDQPGAEAVAAVSPDQKWIAYCRVLGEERDIWAVPAQGGLPHPLVEGAGHDFHPAWSPDGKHLAFVSSRDGDPHVWVAPVRDGAVTGPPVVLTRGDTADYFPCWSPDGQTLAFVRVEGASSDVWIARVDGSEPPRPLTVGAFAECARWERDGLALLVSARWGGRMVSVKRVRLEGGKAEQLAHAIDLGDAAEAGFFDLSPDGRFLVRDEPQSRGDIWLLEARQGRF
jgi:Tol biopolymer transport system component